ncbi:MAG: RbsD/FucU domain-containing protein [Actinomycetota bacterium]
MLTGIHPLLSGELLLNLDAMGHSDSVVVADAHFPAARIGARVVTLPGTSAPEVVAAIRTVLPLDEPRALDLMRTADGLVLPVQLALIDAAGVSSDGWGDVERQEFYELAAAAFLVIRTGETRPYGNALLRKGIVSP